MKEIICAQCGNTLEKGTAVCPFCGNDLELNTAMDPELLAALTAFEQKNEAEAQRARAKHVVPVTPRPAGCGPEGQPVKAGSGTRSQRQTPAARQCPTCGRTLPRGLKDCPFCRREESEQPKVETPPQKKRSLPKILGLAALAVLLVGGGIFLATRDRGQTPRTTDVMEAPDSAAPTGTVTAPTETAAPTETTEAGLSSEEAMVLAQQAYNCEAELQEQTDEGFTFACRRSGVELGTVSVSRDGAIQVLTGMEQSPGGALDTAEIEARVRNHSSSAVYGWCLIDTTTGESFGSENRDTALSASALVDLPILYAVSKQMEQGKLTMDTPVTVTSTSNGRGSLAGYYGQSFTLAQMLDYVLGRSSNDAANALMDHLGIENINRLCHDAGFASVLLTNHIGSTVENTDSDNYISARDAAAIVDELYRADGEINGAYLLEHMKISGSDRNANRGLGRRIGEAMAGNHNGSTAYKYNEVILGRADDRIYVLCFMANGADATWLQSAAAEIGEYCQGVMEQ